MKCVDKLILYGFSRLNIEIDFFIFYRLNNTFSQSVQTAMFNDPINAPILKQSQYSEDLVDVISKQRTSANSDTNNKSVKTGIAERGPPVKKKQTNPTTTSFISQSSQSLPTDSSTSKLPSPNQSNRMYEHVVPLIHSNPSEDVAAYLNYQYLNFPSQNHSNSDLNGKTTSNNIVENRPHHTKRKIVTSSKKMTTAPRAVPQRNPIDKNINLHSHRDTDKDPIPSNVNGGKSNSVGHNTLKSRRSSSPLISQISTRNKLEKPVVPSNKTILARPTSAPPATRYSNRYKEKTPPSSRANHDQIVSGKAANGTHKTSRKG
jgi:hypothetical protein